MKHSKPFLKISAKSKNAEIKNLSSPAHPQTIIKNKQHKIIPIKIGRIQTLYITRFTKHGAYLSAMENTSHNTQSTSIDYLTEVLLPNKFLPIQSKVGDMLEVFVYTDSNDRPVATTQTPKAQYGDIAELEVVTHSPFGCFLDLGIDKHIFMPTKTPTHFTLHQKVIVAITLDKQSRLIAKTHIKSFLHKAPFIAPHSEIDAFIFEHTPLGFGCVVQIQNDKQKDKNTQRYYGLLFTNAIPQGKVVNLGTHIKAYTQGHRDDGKLNLTLFAPHSNNQKATLLESMPLRLDFSSSPQAIFEKIQMSKKLFKRLVNELTREGQIIFDKENGIFRRIK